MSEKQLFEHLQNIKNLTNHTNYRTSLLTRFNKQERVLNTITLCNEVCIHA